MNGLFFIGVSLGWAAGFNCVSLIFSRGGTSDIRVRIGQTHTPLVYYDLTNISAHHLHSSIM